MLSARVNLLQILHKLGDAAAAEAETAEIAAALGGRAPRKDGAGHLDRAMADGLAEAACADAVVAMALNAIGQHERALEAAEAATTNAPSDPHGWAAMGVALIELGDPEAAIEPLERALERRPGWSEIRGALGNALWLAERDDAAAKVLERATDQAPDMPSLWATLGAARRELRDLDGAEAAYARAVALAPDSGKYALSLALTQFRCKKFAEGGRNYERRWETDAFADQDRPHDQPLWQGEDLAGKKILVYAEQGVGDEVMYAGMLQTLIDRGAAVFLEANGRLVRLFERSFPGVFVGPSQNPPLPAFAGGDFDFRIPGGALMTRLAPTYADLVSRGAYLKPDPELVERLRARYLGGGSDTTLLVGIAWRSGNPVNGRRRTADLNLWAPILETPGVRFVNLQYGEAADEIACARSAFGADIVEDAEIDPSLSPPRSRPSTWSSRSTIRPSTSRARSACRPACC